MECEGTDNDVVGLRRVIVILDSHAAVLDTRGVVPFAGFFQHFFREVDAEYMGCPVFNGVSAMPPETASEV